MRTSDKRRKFRQAKEADRPEPKGMRPDNLLYLQVTRTLAPPAERRHLNHPWVLYPGYVKEERGNLEYSPLSIAR